MASYDKVLAQNIRAERVRAGIGQESLANRMKALGFDGWVRQTVGSTEKPSRRVTAEEIFGLALAMEVSMSALLADTSLHAAEVELPGGSIDAKSLIGLVTGRRTRAVTWNDDVPVFGADPKSAMVDEHPELAPGGREHDEILGGEN